MIASAIATFPRGAPASPAYGMEEAGVADFGGVLGQLDVDPAGDVAKGPVLVRPARPFRRAQVVLCELAERLAPVRQQPGDAGRAQVIAFVFGPVRLPGSRRRAAKVQ